MKPYNGFSEAQRNKAQRWLNAQWSAGAFPRPSACCACGQTAGVIHAHAEDYSEPFRHGKTDQYPLCLACHMMVHCRFSNRAAWDAYRHLIGDGWQHSPCRSFPQFTAQLLCGPAAFNVLNGRWAKGRPRARRFLDGIAGKDRP